jgi:DNA-binding NtrC family response regulator
VNITRILLVDDDRLLREVVEDFLRSQDYIVDSAENAVCALASFQPGKYNLALIDQGVHNNGGIKLMKALMTKDSELVCLIMTGYANLKKIKSINVENNTDYIIKPFLLTELLHIVQKYM